MRRSIAACLLSACVFSAVVRAEIGLTAPTDVQAGGQVVINLSGDTQARDFITIVPAAEPEGRYADYKYARSDSVELRAPDEPGEYEIRYLEANRPFTTRARHSLTVTAVTATLEAPAEVDAGATFSVSWTGPDNAQDFIAISPKGADVRKYLHYQYTRKGSPVTLRAPDEPGVYEIRYQTGQSYSILANRAVSVGGTNAAVAAPDDVEAGQQFDVTWSGPDNAQDFIAISPKGADVREYVHYQYTRKGSPVTLRAPDEPGDYEVRYQTGQSYSVLASQVISVGGADAALEASANVGAGQGFDVAWTGPDNAQDFIAISPQGGDVREYRHYRYTREGSPVTLRAPDEPGAYEIRYQTGQDYRILAKRAVTVDAVTATLDGPESVVGGASFMVTWTGPDNAGDYIGITKIDDDQCATRKWAYTRHGSPAKVQAPHEPGQYEIRYRTGQTAMVLATRALTVTPPPTPPGHLLVTVDNNVTGFIGGDAVEIILDASGSMLKQQGGKRRIDIAREVLLDLTGDVIPAGTPFALRVFGHKEADSCRTDLEIPLRALDVSAADAKIRGVRAMNLAKTPIARSLEMVNRDLADVSGERIVILITDGEETCDGDPAAAIEALKASGIDVRVNIVGFNIDDTDLKSQFRYWADIGGGAYHDAANADDLGRSLNHALQAPYEVLDASGEIVANGTVGDSGISLPPGDYRVRTRAKSPLQGNATVVSEKNTDVVLR